MELVPALTVPPELVPQPPPGVTERRTPQGYLIGRVHFSSDPAKDAAWAEGRRRRSPNEETYRMEYEIDFYARSGALMYPEFEEGHVVCPPFTIPHEWTRYMGCDPHKRRPHFFLWMAVDPFGDHWYYRESWESKIYGRPGRVPEDDAIQTIAAYCDALRWLEGEENRYFAPGGFADNGGKQEQIFLRIMDTHGKAIYAETHDGKDDPETFWDRYRKEGFLFREARKDVQAGRDTVGRRLRPRLIADADGERLSPVIHIFNTCPELILELKTNRFPVLTPAQADKQDPTDKELQKRKHATDCLRYIEIEDPQFIEPVDLSRLQHKPIYKGISY